MGSPQDCHIACAGRWLSLGRLGLRWRLCPDHSAGRGTSLPRTAAASSFLGAKCGSRLKMAPWAWAWASLWETASRRFASCKSKIWQWTLNRYSMSRLCVLVALKGSLPLRVKWPAFHVKKIRRWRCISKVPGTASCIAGSPLVSGNTLPCPQGTSSFWLLWTCAESPADLLNYLDNHQHYKRRSTCVQTLLVLGDHTVLKLSYGGAILIYLYWL